MLLETIQLKDGYEIRVECEDGLYRAQGYLNGKPVTTVIEKSVLLAMADVINKSVKDYETSTAKAIQECGIEKCSTLEEAWQAITSKMPDNSNLIYQDIVFVVKTLLEQKPKFLFTGIVS